MTIEDDSDRMPDPKNSWLTAEEAMAKHGVDPILYSGRCRSRLHAIGPHHWIRQFLEADVVLLKGK